MKYTPIHNHVPSFAPVLNNIICVECKEEQEDRESKIVIPETARARHYAKVLKVGNGEWLECGQRAFPEVIPGDIVLLRSSMGAHSQVEGNEYIIATENDILARMEASK